MSGTIVVYRIEHGAEKHGMWYRADGTYDPFIKTLPNAKSASLPMEPDERYGRRGRRWYSAAASVELMHHWFTAEDARALAAAGYEVFEFEVSEYLVEEFQVIFTRESVVRRTPVPLESIWGAAKP